MGGPPGSAGYDTNDMSNPEGVRGEPELGQQGGGRVAGVGRRGSATGRRWRSWRRRGSCDRKLVWWKHKNDYKYWSKQVSAPGLPRPRHCPLALLLSRWAPSELAAARWALRYSRLCLGPTPRFTSENAAPEHACSPAVLHGCPSCR